MKKFTQDEKLIAGVLLAIAVLLTPVAGVWIWLAIGLGLWVGRPGSICYQRHIPIVRSSCRGMLIRRAMGHRTR
jgi:hypothetical protein